MYGSDAEVNGGITKYMGARMFEVVDECNVIVYLYHTALYRAYKYYYALKEILWRVSLHSVRRGRKSKRAEMTTRSIPIQKTPYMHSMK
jgi:hypothetical protein